MNEFQRQCMSFIRRFVELRVLDKSGSAVAADAFERLTDKARYMDRTAALAVAMLAEPAWAGKAGPHPAAAGLRELALRLTDAWAEHFIATCQPGTMPPDFEMVGLPQTMTLLAPHASPARLRLWRKGAAVTARLTAEFLLRKQAAWGKPGPYTGTGPNHLFLLAGSLYRFGTLKLLGEPTWARLARQAMHRICRLQSNEGYFPENVGPAVQYQRVSLAGVCDYYAASGDQFVRPVVERGIRFVIRALYPDLTSIETLDQRNRSHARAGLPGQELTHWLYSFNFSPQGRRLAGLVLARARQRLEQDPANFPLSTFGPAAMAALAHPGGPVARELLCEQVERYDRFDGQAAVVRRHGWCVVVSGYHAGDRPGNPFVLDRTQNLSVFHDRCGLVIGGGNDKHNLRASTFELAESGMVWYFPPIGGKAAVARPGRATLELNYGAAAARLAATIKSAGEVELLAGVVSNFAEQEDWFNLQIPVGPGAKIRIDGRAITLSAKAVAQITWPVAKSIEFAGVRIEPAGGANVKFCWPHLPWNSYNLPTHTSPIESATGFLRVKLTGRKFAERKVRIRLMK